MEGSTDWGWQPSDEEGINGYLVGAYGYRLPVVIEREWNGTEAMVVT